MLRKKTNGVASGARLSTALAGLTGGAIDRRTFLRRSGLTAGGVAAAAALVGRHGDQGARRRRTAAAGAVQQIKTRLHPLLGRLHGHRRGRRTASGSARSRASTARSTSARHCAKGASVREHGHGERRLKYPMKLVGGK